MLCTTEDSPLQARMDMCMRFECFLWLSDTVCDSPPRLQTPPSLINDMLSWQAFEVRGSRGVLRGWWRVGCVCVWVGGGGGVVGGVDRYWWCAAMRHKGGMKGVQREALSGGELVKEEKPVWNSSHELEWLDGSPCWVPTGHPQIQPQADIPPPMCVCFFLFSCKDRGSTVCRIYTHTKMEDRYMDCVHWKCLYFHSRKCYIVVQHRNHRKGVGWMVDIQNAKLWRPGVTSICG